MKCAECDGKGGFYTRFGPDDNYDSETCGACGGSGVERGRWYPEMPPALEGETDDQYTDRLTGADGTNRRPYDHPRNRQCSIGWHEECSDPAGERCKCPCHQEQP